MSPRLNSRSAIPRFVDEVAPPARLPGAQTGTPPPLRYIWRESFNQADSTVLGPDLTWTKNYPGGNPDDGETLSNRLTSYGGTGLFTGQAGEVIARAEAEVGTLDMYAQVEVAALHASHDLAVGVLCNMTIGTPTPGEGFWVQIVRNSGVWTVALYFDRGGQNLDSSAYGGLVAGDVVRIESIATSPSARAVTALVNGSTVASASVSIPASPPVTGQCGGVEVGEDGWDSFPPVGTPSFNPGDTALDNFECGPL